MITARNAADFVEEYATLLELSGASPFRVRAYANAVRALETLTSPSRRASRRRDPNRGQGHRRQRGRAGRRVRRHRHGPSL